MPDDRTPGGGNETSRGLRRGGIAPGEPSAGLRRRRGRRARATPLTVGALWAAVVLGAAAAGANNGPASACSNAGPRVVRVFCGGLARVTVTRGSTVYHLNHGTCAFGGAYFGVNAGAVVSPGHAGARPDSVGMDLPGRPGPFKNALIDVTFAGKSTFLNSDKGTVAADFESGTFSGPSGGYLGQPTVEVSGTFTC